MRYVHLAYGHDYDVVFENLNPTDVIICPASITLVGLVGMGVEKQSRNELILYSLSLLATGRADQGLVLWQRQKTEGGLLKKNGRSLVTFPCVGNDTCPGWPSASFSSLLRNLLEHSAYLCLSRYPAKSLEHFF